MTKKLREKIFERDNYTCQWCGKNDIDEKMLLPAHIRTACLCGDDRETNLITLCRYCYNHVSNKEIMRKFETAENRREFNALYQQRVAGYGDYVNYIKSVFSSNGLTGTRPQIDRFVKACLITEDEQNRFKKELQENPKVARQIMTQCFIKKIAYAEYKIKLQERECEKDTENKNDSQFKKILKKFVTNSRYETNWNLPAFMTDGILNPLGQRLFELGEVE